ncbi:MAG: AraC family transcriptional regulator [Bacteroidales bacterium]|nr:AraC family transcriptional regulator [Bacteroidales bacterium]MCF8456303.1 AraC family transcriptional regulator [Bacteroidales bacterium]
MGIWIRFAGLLTFLFLNTYAYSFSQIDSLRNLLHHSDTSNTAKIYNELAYAYHRINFDSTGYYANQAIHEAGKNMDKPNIAQGNYYLGLVQYLSQHYDSAITKFTQSLSSWEDIGNRQKIADLIKFIGICHAAKGDNIEAIDFFDRALQINQELENDNEVAQIYGNLGMACRSLSKYQEAIDYFINALDYFDKTENISGKANTYNHLGNIFRDWDNYGKALEYYEKGIAIIQEIDNPALKAGILNNMGIIYRKMGDFEKSIDLQTQSLEIKKELGNKRGMGDSYLGLGITFKQKGDFSQALEYYLKAVEIKKEVHDKTGEGATLGNIGLLYIAMNQPDKAITFFEQSNKIAELLQYKELLKNNAEGLSEAYELKRNYKKALYYSNLHHVLQDSIFNVEKHRQIEEIETRYETEKKIQEIALLQVQNELKDAKSEEQIKEIEMKDMQLMGLIVFLIFVLISVLLVAIQLRYKNRAYKDLVKKNIELTALQNPASKTKTQVHLSDEKMAILLSELEVYFKSAKPYISPDFHLAECAKHLETNSKYLSQTINEVYQNNFNNFINEFRIKEARVLLSNNTAKNYTIEAIAADVGFNSKSTFNSAFKKFTGVTPSYYQANIKSMNFMD